MTVVASRDISIRVLRDLGPTDEGWIASTLVKMDRAYNVFVVHNAHVFPRKGKYMGGQVSACVWIRNKPTGMEILVPDSLMLTPETPPEGAIYPSRVTIGGMAN